MKYNPRTGEPIIDPALGQAYNTATAASQAAYGATYKPMGLRGRPAAGLHGGAAAAAAGPRATDVLAGPMFAFMKTPQGQQYGQQVAEWSKWAGKNEPGFLKSVLHGLGNMPIIGGVVKGATELFDRPGDLIHDPLKYVGAAAQTAAPFLTGPLGQFGAKMLGTGGGILESGAYKNPASLVPGAISMAGSAIGGDTGNAIKYGMTGLNLAQKAGVIPGNGRAAQPMATPATTRAPGIADIATTGLGLSANTDQGNSGLAQASLQKGGSAYGDLGAFGSALINGNNEPRGLMANYQNTLNSYANAGGAGNAMTPGGATADPYSLDQNQQNHLNQGIDLINGQRATGEQALKAHFAKMGAQPNDPRVIAAMERLHSNFDNDVNTHRSSYLEQIRKGKQDTTGNLAQMLQSGGQFQQNQTGQGLQALGQAGAGYTGQAHAYNQLGQAASQRTNTAADNLGNTVGLGAKLWTNLANKGGGGGGINFGGNGSGYRTNPDGSPMMYGPDAAPDPMYDGNEFSNGADEWFGGNNDNYGLDDWWNN